VRLRLLFVCGGGDRRDKEQGGEIGRVDAVRRGEEEATNSMIGGGERKEEKRRKVGLEKFTVGVGISRGGKKLRKKNLKEKTKKRSAN